MAVSQKKRRRLVVTCGGAKGWYQGGIIHAFHIAGMEFDAIIGASIGTFNSLFSVEYLLRKKELSPDARNDPQKAMAAMGGLAKAYHQTSLQMLENGIVDDTEAAAPDGLEERLAHIKTCPPHPTHIWWWWTDLECGTIPPRCASGQPYTRCDVPTGATHVL